MDNDGNEFLLELLVGLSFLMLEVLNWLSVFVGR